MIRLVWRTDVHLSDVAPASRTDDWMDTCFEKLDQIKDLCGKIGATALLDGGDLFHIKSPSRNSHRLVERAAAHHADYPCPVFVTPGNHDAVYGDYAYLPQQPLGVLYAAGVVNRLYDEHEAVFEQDGVKVRVVGVPYHGTVYDMGRFKGIVRGDEDVLICVAHVLASPGGGSMFEGEDIVKYADLLDTAPDVFCYLPGTSVSLADGRTIPIEDVVGSLSLQGRDGPTVVEQVHPVRNVDEDVVVLDVEGVPQSLIPGVTRDHPFWVAKDLRCRIQSRSGRRCHPDKVRSSYPCSSCREPPAVVPGWCGAGGIVAGDYMSIPYPKIPRDAVSEPGLARLLGYYVHPRTQYGNNSVQLCAYGAEIAGFCEAHGGRHASRKALSPWVWGLDADSRLQLLAGWLLGDGHARSGKIEVSGCTVSPSMANQLFQMALSVGLRPYYTIRPARSGVSMPGGGVSDTLPAHIISFYGDDGVLLSRLMGVTPPDRSKTKVSGFFRDGLFWRRVRKVNTMAYKGPVYNMRTSTEEYVAGLLLTHNCFGHWHKDQGVREMGGKTFVNIGSLTRGSLSQDEVKRRPAIAVLLCEKGKVEVKVARIKVKPPEEVFDMEARVRVEARESTMEAFVASVRQTLVESKGHSIEEKIAGAKIDERVREKALLYMERSR